MQIHLADKSVVLSSQSVNLPLTLANGPFQTIRYKTVLSLNFGMILKTQ